MQDSHNLGARLLQLPLLSQPQLYLPGVQGPVQGLCLGAQGEFLVARKEGITRLTREGRLLGDLQGGRPFSHPSDLLLLSSGQLVVRDAMGIQLFSEDGNFLRTVCSR